MKRLFYDFLDLLYPSLCPGCGNAFNSGEKDLCLSCSLDLPFFNNELIAEDILGGRIAVKNQAIYLKFYAGGITQRLLHQVKYKNNLKLASWLGSSFMQHNGNTERFADVEMIIPVPLHKEKLKQRGYNQSELIASGIAQVLGKPVESSLVSRIAKSETQTRKSREQRWENVAGIFECDAAVKGKHVLLVDDVITTGATMEACALAVLEAKAQSISFVALASAM